MATGIPDDGHRRRCSGCGNLTRLDVTRTRRRTEFWHFGLAGHHQVEDTDGREESVDDVACRWCGRSDAVGLAPRHPADHQTAGP